MTGIRKTKTAWLINIDEFTGRDRYYTGTRADVVLRTTDDPMQPHNVHFETVADLLIALYHDDNLPRTCSIYRKGHIIQ